MADKFGPGLGPGPVQRAGMTAASFLGDVGNSFLGRPSRFDPPKPASTGTPGVQGPATAAAPTPGLASIGIKPPDVTGTAPIAAPEVKEVPRVAPPTAAKITPPGGDGRADSLNAFYNQQGYGPASTGVQVDKARGDHNAGIARGSIHNPAAVGPPAVTPGTSPQIAPGIGVSGPAAQAPSSQPGVGISQAPAGQRDLARDAIVQGLRYHQQMSRSAMQMPDALTEGMTGPQWNAAVLQHAAALQAHDASVAKTKQGDSIGNLAALGKLGPREQALYVAGQGQDPRVLQSMPTNPVPGQTPYNASNYGQAGQFNPEMAGPAAVLSGDQPIHEKAATFASYPGIENTDNPNRQLFDAFMQNQQARGSAFDKEMGQYNPLDPKHAPVADTSNPMAIIHSIFGAAREGMFGADPAIQKRNAMFAHHMGQLGYGAVPATVSSQGIGIQAQPTDQ